jgi:hypothetical protein
MRMSSTIGLMLAVDMTVADIVRNAPRTGHHNMTHHPDHGELPLELGWRLPS